MQQSRLNLTPNGGLKRALSRSSSKEKKDQRLWITSVPKEISDAVSSDEKKRQEVIYELIYTEKDFVNDLKYLNDVCTNEDIRPNTGNMQPGKVFVCEA